MTPIHLTSLAILTIESYALQVLNYDHLIDEFVNRSSLIFVVINFLVITIIGYVREKTEAWSCDNI